MQRLLRYVLLFVFVAFTNAALAQGAAGSIAGRLLDPNGLPIGNLDQQSVVLTMTETATGKVYSVPVQASGSYELKGLPAGNYDLSVPIQGAMYRSFEQKSVTIAAGKTLRKDLPIPWSINLGTIGDDPTTLSNDLRARSKDTAGPTPRTAEGKPDFSGIWYNVPNNTPRARVPMKPWAEEISKQLQRINQGENGGPGNQGPAAYCLPQSAIPLTLPFPYEFVQTPGRMVQITEFTTPAYRMIYMDGRKHPEEWNPAWYGHSVGHWEGDTLVVDTVGFNEITPGFGVHSEKLHVVERIRRPSRGQLIVDITAEDPEAWTGPYQTQIVAGLVTGEEILEFVCPENNKDPLHFGGLGWKGRP
jgi:hypothetical protein